MLLRRGPEKSSLKVQNKCLLLRDEAGSGIKVAQDSECVFGLNAGPDNRVLSRH